MIWGNRLAGSRAATGSTRRRSATRPSACPRRAGRSPRSSCSAAGSRSRSTAAASLGDAQVWLQELDGSRRQLVRKVSSGEADRSFVGLSFDGGALYFAQICSGDPSGCPGHGIAYRYASGKLETASVPLDLGGFAQAAGTSYWVTQHYGDCLDDEGADAPCVIDARS